MKGNRGPVSRAVAVALATALWFTQLAAFGWGSTGHTDINQAAAETIPVSMPKFLRTKSAVQKIAYLGPEPDRWRDESPSALNYAQAPDHFIDLERIEGLGPLPLGRYDFYKLLYAKRAATPAADHPDDYLPDRVGLQPYITIEVYKRLELAFRSYREMKKKKQKTDVIDGNIIFYMGWLGHYVGDGSQPLHTSIQYDGWAGANPDGYTTQHGIHAEFETDFVNRVVPSPASFASLVNPPQRISDPFSDYMKYLEASHALVPQVYAFEKAKAYEGAGSPDAVKFLDQRLAAGSQMLIDLWYTAWLQSGEPLQQRLSRLGN
ncbi:MAG: nuclease [Candidatus Acidiferrales bacterium]